MSGQMGKAYQGNINKTNQESFFSVDTNVNDCANVLNAFLTTVFQPFGNYCGNAVEIEHHDVPLFFLRIVEPVQNGLKDVVKQLLINRIERKG